MSKTNYTSGPWRVVAFPEQPERRVTVQGSSGMVADCDWCGRAENQANAQLIAAAPDLLAALEKVAALMARNGSGNVLLHSEIRAAIAKATGQAPA